MHSLTAEEFEKLVVDELDQLVRDARAALIE